MTTHVERVIFGEMEELKRKLGALKILDGPRPLISHYRSQFELINELALQLVLIGEAEYLDNKVFMNDFD
jgi:hypothetical protein